MQAPLCTGSNLRSHAHGPKALDAEQLPKTGDQDDQRADDRRRRRLAETPAPDVWYYADQRGRVGILSLDELKNTLATLPNANDELVWAEHLSEWKRVRDAPDLVEPQAQPPASQKPESQALPSPPSASEHLFAAPSAPAEYGSPTTEGRKPLRKWLSKIETREDALKAISDISIAFFAVAALQAVLGVFLIGVDVFVAADVALYVGLAVWLRYGKSRLAAVALLAQAAVSMGSTIAAQLNLITGGRNVALAAITLYAAAKAVEATFKLKAACVAVPLIEFDVHSLRCAKRAKICPRRLG